MRRWLLAEFETPETLARALLELRQHGFRKLDAYTPYSTELVREALGLPESRLGVRVFAAGTLGAAAAYGLQWYLVAYSYPLNVGGRPPHLPLAFVPITFEMGILCAAIAAFVSALWLGRLPRLWRPLFEVEGFESASRDRFWLSVDANDPSFHPESTPAMLAELQPSRQVLLTWEE